jgi:sarcosine oxidase gamma subunit
MEVLQASPTYAHTIEKDIFNVFEPESHSELKAFLQQAFLTCRIPEAISLVLSTGVETKQVQVNIHWVSPDQLLLMFEQSEEDVDATENQGLMTLIQEQSTTIRRLEKEKAMLISSTKRLLRA